MVDIDNAAPRARVAKSYGNAPASRHGSVSTFTRFVSRASPRAAPLLSLTLIFKHSGAPASAVTPLIATATRLLLRRPLPPHNAIVFLATLRTIPGNACYLGGASTTFDVVAATSSSRGSMPAARWPACDVSIDNAAALINLCLLPAYCHALRGSGNISYHAKPHANIYARNALPAFPIITIAWRRLYASLHRHLPAKRQHRCGTYRRRSALYGAAG